MFQLHEIELNYKSSIASSADKVTCSQDAERILRANWKGIAIYESAYVVYLNQGGRILGIQQLSSGGINYTIVDVRLILATALKCLAVSMILAHNHPSGNLKPSLGDEVLTEKLHKACRFHDVKLHDHLILSPESGEYLSMADRGLISQ